MGAELTLAAALRDSFAQNPEVRGVAIRNLAPALLDELGLKPPAWWSRIEHPRRAEVVETLERACADAAPQNAAIARIGLAELAAPQARERARELLAIEGEDEATMFGGECAVIALSLIGAAARDFLATPDAASDGEQRAAATAAVERILGDLRELIDDPRDHVRFQIGPALVEVGGAALEPELLAALDREDHPEIRENLVAALAMLDPPSPAALDVLAQVLAGDQGKGAIGWEAALVLTAARRTEGAARLLAGLASRMTRDRALEALAVLGERAPPEAAAAIRRYTRGFFVPVFTKVRAAYALARIVPEEGLALLDRLARHPRPAVREAVAEARSHLAELGSEGDPTDRSAYRRE